MASTLRGFTREADLGRSSHDVARSPALRGPGRASGAMDVFRGLQARLVRLIGKPSRLGQTHTPARASSPEPATLLPGRPELLRAPDWSALVTLVNKFSPGNDVKPVLQELCQYLVETAQCTFARVYVPDDSSPGLTLCAACSIRGDEHRPEIERAFPARVPDWPWVGVEGGNSLVMNREREQGRLSPVQNALLFGGGCQSSLLLPLATPHAFFGVVLLSEMRSWTRSPFAPEKVARCELVVQHAALALENSRLRSDEQELSRTKRDFVSLISHELRVPLTHISAIAHLLAQGISDEQEKKDLLQSIDLESERLLYLAQVMPEVLNPGPAQTPTPLEVVSVTRILEQRVRFFRSRFADHVFEFEVPAAPVLAWGNAILLSVVLDNLLSNAVKYSPPGSAIRARIEEADAQVLVSIEDRGIGIPRAELDRIFSRGHRVPDPAAQRVPGSGLGLYIASQLIKRQGGTLWAESDYGRGARLCFRITKIEAADE